MKIYLMKLLFFSKVTTMLGSLHCNSSVGNPIVNMEIKFLQFQRGHQNKEQMAWCVPRTYEVTKPPFLCKFWRIIYVSEESKLPWDKTTICFRQEGGGSEDESSFHIFYQRNKWGSRLRSGVENTDVLQCWMGGRNYIKSECNKILNCRKID